MFYFVSCTKTHEYIYTLYPMTCQKSWEVVYKSDGRWCHCTLYYGISQSQTDGIFREIVGTFDIYLQFHVCAGNTLWTSLLPIVDSAVGDNRSLLIVWLELTLVRYKRHKSHLHYNAGGTRDISNKSASVIYLHGIWEQTIHRCVFVNATTSDTGSEHR